MMRRFFGDGTRGGDPPRRELGRGAVRLVLLALSVFVILPSVLPSEAISQAHVDKGGTVGIQNPTEKSLFFNLICMCGCPRETLGTCTCGYANERREELRGMLAQGMTVEAVTEAYGKRFGTHAIALPPNKGASRLIWALPLLAFVVGAVFAVRMLRRWTKRGAESATAQNAATKKRNEEAGISGPPKRDEYDDKLDRELKELE